MTLTFSTAGDVERQARLRRMKLLALSFLLFAAVLYLATLMVPLTARKAKNMD